MKISLMSAVFVSAQLSTTVFAQNINDNFMQFLPTSERFMSAHTQQQTEFSEPTRGPANTPDIYARPNTLKNNRDSFKENRISQNTSEHREEKALSRIEEIYAGRVKNELEQYGYDLFTKRSSETGHAGQEKRTDETYSTIPLGAVQDSFVLGVGDQIDIMFSGQRSEQKTYTVSSSGMVTIQDFLPLPAAGRTLGEFRTHINAAAQNLHNTETFVTLSRVRQIGVLVIGHVNEPGKKRLSAFHTVIDALIAAGGIEKTGSLRQIKLVRDGRSQTIDMYGLLMDAGHHIDLNLRDGDRLIIPPIGPTMAVSGEVKRPGIYELLPKAINRLNAKDNNTRHLNLNEALHFAGHTLSPGNNRFLKLELSNDGRDIVSDVTDHSRAHFGGGSILVVSKGQAKRSQTVELKGHTRNPGLYALNEHKSLRTLIHSEYMLDEDIYPLIGVIERWDPDQLTHRFISFPLRLALQNEHDRRLQDGDIVHLFSNAQINALHQGNAAEAIEDVRTAENIAARQQTEDHLLDRKLASYLREHSAFVRGAVRAAGPYPISDGTSLDSLLAVAGGMTLEANNQNIEITTDLIQNQDGNVRRQSVHRQSVDFAKENPKLVMIGPGDSVRVNQKFKKIEDKSILIMGEVNHPGRYDLMPGDKLSDLLERAGGYTQQAYPPAAIFSRESERLAEKSRFRAQAREIKRAIASALQMDDEKVGYGKISEARALASELTDIEGLGRITVEADLGKLQSHPELDILLEAKDRIFIPKRTLNVRVNGEVLSPAALQFREGKSPLDYIREAGGFGFHADKGRTFVLYPDGSAQPLQVSSWNHKATFIPPGSTIIVPRDPEPFDFIESAKDVSQILSNLAITSIFIDDIADDD